MKGVSRDIDRDRLGKYIRALATDKVDINIGYVQLIYRDSNDQVVDEGIVRLALGCTKVHI